MLSPHTAGQVKYWMFQCLIPLDIVWMTGDRRIVEISANTPPCPPASSSAPYAALQFALVLELAGECGSTFEIGIP